MNMSGERPVTTVKRCQVLKALKCALKTKKLHTS